MLLGYDPNGEISFIFTDEKYLALKYPNNTAKISNFWGTAKHNLKEFFVPINIFNDWENYRYYKIINGNIVKKTDEEINKLRKNNPVIKDTLHIDDVTKNNINSVIEIKREIQ